MSTTGESQTQTQTQIPTPSNAFQSIYNTYSGDTFSQLLQQYVSTVNSILTPPSSSSPSEFVLMYTSPNNGSSYRSIIGALQEVSQNLSTLSSTIDNDYTNLYNQVTTVGNNAAAQKALGQGLAKQYTFAESQINGANELYSNYKLLYNIATSNFIILIIGILILCVRIYKFGNVVEPRSNDSMVLPINNYIMQPLQNNVLNPIQQNVINPIQNQLPTATDLGFGSNYNYM